MYMHPFRPSATSSSNDKNRIIILLITFVSLSNFHTFSENFSRKNMKCRAENIFIRPGWQNGAKSIAGHSLSFLEKAQVILARHRAYFDCQNLRLVVPVNERSARVRGREWIIRKICRPIFASNAVSWATFRPHQDYNNIFAIIVKICTWIGFLLLNNHIFWPKKFPIRFYI